MARSRAVTKVTPPSGQPFEVPKLLPVSPSRSRAAFICVTKAGSVPDMPSASTTQASFPDRVMMP